MTRFRAAFCFILVLNAASRIVPTLADNAVPVLLWGGSVSPDSEKSAVNPFLKTSSKEFDLFLRKRLENLPPVLLYVKDNLCTEDLVKHKQLQKMTTGDSLHYFPAVERAVDTLEDLPSYNQTYSDYADSASDGQLLIVPISNFDAIPETYKTIKESTSNLITILTGKSCSYNSYIRSERVKRETANEKNFTILGDYVLLYSSHPLLLQFNGTNTELSSPTVIDNKGKNSVNMTLTFNETKIADVVKHKLDFIFKILTSGYYSLKTISYTRIYKDSTEKGGTQKEVTLETNRDIVFPFNFSYHCSQNVTFKQNLSEVSSVLLNIKNLQVQIDAKSLKNSNRTKVFSDAYDCVGFTTIPIWTGIFVTAILALIMIWGLSMIIDIRTMDRFDDPKGKTITISAAD
ncbi:uncharacterized protein LOC108630642 isoform X2 [Ceratina calcarata]|uniref:Uncharacterized protein LOC108630642 isoform X2 n=1 Tax=Ceratina calcarata TaxID=156304 RepID=A0AAJ7JCM4_9HYME|nr:uncharacterized protein LOC108630642 isoform X2 [Ceratina calcarata]